MLISVAAKRNAPTKQKNSPIAPKNYQFLAVFRHFLQKFRAVMPDVILLLPKTLSNNALYN